LSDFEVENENLKEDDSKIIKDLIGGSGIA
jgi:hypothetical protein